MTRWRVTIEYDGGPYVGWQRQDNGPSIQQAVEEAVFAFCGENVRVFGAGRTDAGVHAFGQVAHLDIDRPTTADTVRDALNAYLREVPISILAAAEAPEGFHARISARERVYLYRILNRRPPPAIDEGRVWHVPWVLDADAMHEAAQCLVGTHDFTSFRASVCQAKSPVKTLDVLDIQRAGEEIHLHARGRSFLHHQIRNIIGTLERVGAGKWTVDDVSAALAARDRAAAGSTAPPEGLYLVSVAYPDTSDE
jgi:tRNA pseudouridine38-40 synthase